METSLKSNIENFLYDQEIKNYSRSTNRSYKKCLHHFLSYAEQNKIEDVTKFTPRDINVFKERLFLQTHNDKRLSVGYQKRILITVQQFFKYLVKEGVIQISPARKLSLPREENRVSRNFLTRNEMERFLASIDSTTIIGFMDRTIFELFYSTGIRQNELLSLSFDDVKIEDGLLYIINGKGGKDRVCILTTICKRYLVEWINDVRERYLKQDMQSNILFPTTFGKRLDSKQLITKIKRYLRLASIEKKISPHAFRRSFATHLLAEGIDVRYIQRLLGHSFLTTTTTYLTVTIENLREIILKCHPEEKNNSPLIFVNKASSEEMEPSKCQ